MAEKFHSALDSPQLAELQGWWNAVPDRAVFEAYCNLVDAIEKRAGKDAIANALLMHAKLVREFRAAPCPPALEVARDHYADGWAGLVGAIALTVERGRDGGESAVAYQQIGIARGYAQALGVTTWSPPNARLYFK